MGMLVFALPILPGKTPEWRRFIAELQGPRRTDFVESRRNVGMHERVWLQSTAAGDLALLYLQADDLPAAMGALDAGGESDTFRRWFVEQVRRIHGVDLTQPPAGPPSFPPELVLDTEAD